MFLGDDLRTLALLETEHICARTMSDFAGFLVFEVSFLITAKQVPAQGQNPLTTTAVSALREEYAALHGEEIAAILQAQEGLASIRWVSQTSRRRLSG